MSDWNDTFRVSMARQMVDDLLAGRPGRIADILEEFANCRLDPGIKTAVLEDLRAREELAEQKVFRHVIGLLRATGAPDRPTRCGSARGAGRRRT